MLSDACIYPRYSWRATRRLISVQLGRTYRSERKERQTDCCNCDPCILAEGGRVSTKIVSKIVGLELITTTWPGFASANSPSRNDFDFPRNLPRDIVARLFPKISIVSYFTFSFPLPQNIKLYHGEKIPLSPGHFVASVSKFRDDHVGNLDSLTHLRNTSADRPTGS